MYTCICLLFCSIAITEAGKVGDPLTVNFFKEEYTLNFTIGEDVINNIIISYAIIMCAGTLKTPYVALLDGITMGGVSFCTILHDYIVHTIASTCGYSKQCVCVCVSVCACVCLRV